MLGTDPLGSEPLGSVPDTGTPEVRVSQAQVFTVNTSAPDLRLSQAQVFSVINFPTEELRISQAQVVSVLKPSLALRLSQTQVFAVVRGRIANSRLRAWTFTLDGHDFYVLRLGDDSTLVYDVYSEQWMDWTSPDLDFWRPNTGRNWVGGTALADTYGSDVVAGDDTFGLLWFLDPEQPHDENPDALDPDQENYFERVTMGQVPMRGREVLPCYVAWLTADMGDPAYTGAGVTLSTSDDGGETFDSHGLVTVTAGTYTPELSWYSLGQISAPGRLFKIVDDGAITRIDGLEMNDAG